MKRFHVHVAVANLAESIRFYSALFDRAPAVEMPDYAKWMLDDPRINFAISQRGQKPGVDHLGIQVETEDELQEVNRRLSAAEMPLAAQTGTVCCYAQSDKYWSVDPQGVPWEAFHTLADAPTYGNGNAQQSAGSCCAPAPSVTFIKRRAECR